MVVMDGLDVLKYVTELVPAGGYVTPIRNGKDFGEVLDDVEREKKPSILGTLKCKAPDDLVFPNWIVQDDGIVVKYLES